MPTCQEYPPTHTPSEIPVNTRQRFPNFVRAVEHLFSTGLGRLPPMTFYGDLGHDADTTVDEGCGAFATDMDHPSYVEGVTPNLTITVYNNGTVEVFIYVK